MTSTQSFTESAVAVKRALTRDPQVRPSEGARLRMARRERTYRLLLASSDVVAMAVSLLVTTVGFSPAHSSDAPMIALAPGILVLAKLTGLYDRDELLLRRSTLDEVPRLFNLATLATLMATVAVDAYGDHSSDAQGILVSWAVLLGTLMLLRFASRGAAARIAVPERCLLIGSERDGERLEGKLASTRGADLIGVVPLTSVTGDAALLARIVAEWNADRLVVAPPTTGSHDDAMNVIRSAKATGLRVSILPGVLEVVGSSVEFDTLPGLTLLGVKRFGLTRSSSLLKRTFDLVGAIVALVAFVPLMLVAAVLIKWSSRGPVFFRQTRVGRDGERFEMLKFRSMLDGSDERRSELAELNIASGGLFKVENDPRITTVGRILRKTSLDELPQLLNVVRGEMSLVGPRPLVVYEDDLVTGFDRRRLLLTPGMTGPWQVAGGGERVSLGEMVKMDYIYVASWSLWGDVKICLRTVRYMLAAGGR